MLYGKSPSSHLFAILQALLVTFLWSTSWVLIKIGLKASLPALTFAGLRYTLAFLCLLLPVLVNAECRNALKGISRAEWGELAGLGLLFYTLTQGAQFLSLAYLPAAMVSLLLNLTPVAVGLLGMFFLRERPTRWQWIGVAVSAVGTVVYFMPLALPPTQVVGLVVALVSVLTNAGSSILGRRINHSGQSSPLVVTFVSMGIGALGLLLLGITTQGVGSLTWTQWGIIAWLAVVNTALAFTLWNHTLRTLSAVESSILNGLMLPQIAVLAVVFLGEMLAVKHIAGLALVGLGAVMTQLGRK
jgi:drug/metabolite transporter (DMT)-like permease